MLTSLLNESHSSFQLRELVLFDELSQAPERNLELEPCLMILHTAMVRMLGEQHMYVALYDAETALFRFVSHYANGKRRSLIEQWSVCPRHDRRDSAPWPDGAYRNYLTECLKRA